MTHRCILLLFACGLVLSAEPPSWVTDLRTETADELSPAAWPLAAPLPAADVTARYDPPTGVVEGRLRLFIDNGGAAPLQTIGLNLYANGSSYDGCSITLSDASVDGRATTISLVDGDRGALLALPEALAPGEWVSCSVAFRTQLAEAGGGRGNLLARLPSCHTLYSWLPEPAAQIDGAWSFPDLPVMADPSHVRLADYRCRLRLPESWSLIASGHEQRTDDGWLLLVPRCRNLVAWLSDWPLQVLSLEHGGRRIRVAFHGRQTITAAFCASVARDTLTIADEAFGPYPRRSYDIVFMPFSEDVGGMEASGLTFIGSDLAEAFDRTADDPLQDTDARLLHAVIHEVLHSWWYGQVGNATYTGAWLDEPLTEWSTWYVYEQLRSRQVSQNHIRTFLFYLTWLGEDLVPMTATADRFSDMQFGMLLYVRAPLLYAVLRQRVGDEVFLDCLRDWYRSGAGNIVDRADWEEHFLVLLPAEERADFVATWLDGTDDLLPESVATVIDPDLLATLHNLIEQRAGVEDDADNSESTDRDSDPARANDDTAGDERTDAASDSTEEDDDGDLNAGAEAASPIGD